MAEETLTLQIVANDASAVEALKSVIERLGQAKEAAGEIGKAGKDMWRGFEGGTAIDAVKRVVDRIRDMREALEDSGKRSRGLFDALATGAREYNKYLDEVGKRDVFGKMKQGLGEVKNLWEQARGTFGGFTGFVVDKLVDVTKSTMEYADRVNKLSLTTGIAAKDLQRLGFAAEQNESSMEAVGIGLKFLSRNLSAAAAGSKEAIEKFERFGIAIKDASGNMRSSTDVLMELADVMQRTQDGTQRQAMAMELLGKSGVDLIPLLSQGSKVIQEMGDRAESLGAVISDTTVRAVDEFNDQMAALETSGRKVGETILQYLLPGLQGILGWVEKNITAFRDLIGAYDAGTEAFRKKVDEELAEREREMFAKMDDAERAAYEAAKMRQQRLQSAAQDVAETVKAFSDRSKHSAKEALAAMQGLLEQYAEKYPALVGLIQKAIADFKREATIGDLEAILKDTTLAYDRAIEKVKAFAAAHPEFAKEAGKALKELEQRAKESIQVIIDQYDDLGNQMYFLWRNQQKAINIGMTDVARESGEAMDKLLRENLARIRDNDKLTAEEKKKAYQFLLDLAKTYGRDIVKLEHDITEAIAQEEKKRIEGLRESLRAIAQDESLSFRDRLAKTREYIAAHGEIAKEGYAQLRSIGKEWLDKIASDEDLTNAQRISAYREAMSEFAKDEERNVQNIKEAQKRILDLLKSGLAEIKADESRGVLERIQLLRQYVSEHAKTAEERKALEKEVADFAIDQAKRIASDGSKSFSERIEQVRAIMETYRAEGASLEKIAELQKVIYDLEYARFKQAKEEAFRRIDDVAASEESALRLKIEFVKRWMAEVDMGAEHEKEAMQELATLEIALRDQIIAKIRKQFNEWETLRERQLQRNIDALQREIEAREAAGKSTINQRRRLAAEEENLYRQRRRRYERELAQNDELDADSRRKALEDWLRDELKRDDLTKKRRKKLNEELAKIEKERIEAEQRARDEAAQKEGYKDAKDKAERERRAAEEKAKAAEEAARAREAAEQANTDATNANTDATQELVKMLQKGIECSCNVTVACPCPERPGETPMPTPQPPATPTISTPSAAAGAGGGAPGGEVGDATAQMNALQKATESAEQAKDDLGRDIKETFAPGIPSNATGAIKSATDAMHRLGEATKNVGEKIEQISPEERERKKWYDFLMGRGQQAQTPTKSFEDPFTRGRVREMPKASGGKGGEGGKSGKGGEPGAGGETYTVGVTGSAGGGGTGGAGGGGGGGGAGGPGGDANVDISIFYSGMGTPGRGGINVATQEIASAAGDPMLQARLRRKYWFIFKDPIATESRRTDPRRRSRAKERENEARAAAVVVSSSGDTGTMDQGTVSAVGIAQGIARELVSAMTVAGALVGGAMPRIAPGYVDTSKMMDDAKTVQVVMEKGSVVVGHLNDPMDRERVAEDVANRTGRKILDAIKVQR